MEASRKKKHRGALHQRRGNGYRTTRGPAFVTHVHPSHLIEPLTCIAHEVGFSVGGPGCLTPGFRSDRCKPAKEYLRRAGNCACPQRPRQIPEPDGVFALYGSRMSCPGNIRQNRARVQPVAVFPETHPGIQQTFKSQCSRPIGIIFDIGSTRRSRNVVAASEGGSGTRRRLAIIDGAISFGPYLEPA
jgi:hypothetical protein